MIVAKPHHCEEASLFAPPGCYLPCNEPATKIVTGRDGVDIAMCDMCADHNTKNRGARSERPYDPEGYESPIAAANARESTSPLTGVGAWLDSLPVPPVAPPPPVRDLAAEARALDEASKLLEWKE